MALLTEQGRIRLAKEVAKLPIYMAWGAGDPALSTDEWVRQTNAEAEYLMAPVGILAVTEKCFVVNTKDENKAEIDVDTGLFFRSPHQGSTPTKHLYLKFQFDFDHAQGQTIRELGVYVGTELANKPLYVDLKQTALKDLGDLMLLEHRRPIHRDVGVRETFEFVITF